MRRKYSGISEKGGGIVFAILFGLLLVFPISPAHAQENPGGINTTVGTSRNWSGYAATTGIFTGVAGTWTVPHITPSGHTAADSTWVGIGGVKKSDLIQSGTLNYATSDGKVNTSAFLELLPATSVPIPVTVTSGDSVTASIMLESAENWRIVFKNNTTGESYNTLASYTSSLSSAEWIQEAPSNGNQEVPLDNFSAVQFTGATAIENEAKVTVADSGATPITMADGRNQTLATPLPLASNGTDFTVARAATTTSPVAQLDRSLQRLERYGVGVAHYSRYTPLPRGLWQTTNPANATPSAIPIPETTRQIRVLFWQWDY